MSYTDHVILYLLIFELNVIFRFRLLDTSLSCVLKLFMLQKLLFQIQARSKLVLNKVWVLGGVSAQEGRGSGVQVEGRALVYIQVSITQ